jgi:hypothetical protein
MGEPPLAGNTDLATYRERFRLLVLPSFWPAYAYRIDVRQDGAAYLRWARLSGRGGYEPGQLVRQGTRPLRSHELREWRQALTVLASVTRETQNEADGTVNSDGSQNVSICVDGTMLVLERLTTTGRDYVIRDCEIEASLRRLVTIVSRMMPRNRMN